VSGRAPPLPSLLEEPPQSDLCVTHPQGSLAPLETLLDRLIPSDESVGANELSLGEELRRRLPDVDRLLDQVDFDGLSPVEQDAWLLRLERERDPTFEALLSLAHELYYSNPASWQSIGYTTRVPGRP
jgi:hypothetical protein